MRMLQTGVPAIFSVIVFISMRFQPFSIVPTYTICICVSVLIHFQEHFSEQNASSHMRFQTKRHKCGRQLLDEAPFCAMVISPTNVYL